MRNAGQEIVFRIPSLIYKHVDVFAYSLDILMQNTTRKRSQADAVPKQVCRVILVKRSVPIYSYMPSLCGHFASLAASLPGREFSSWYLVAGANHGVTMEHTCGVRVILLGISLLVPITVLRWKTLAVSVLYVRLVVFNILYDTILIFLLISPVDTRS